MSSKIGFYKVTDIASDIKGFYPDATPSFVKFMIDFCLQKGITLIRAVGSNKHNITIGYNNTDLTMSVNRLNPYYYVCSDNKSESKIIKDGDRKILRKYPIGDNNVCRQIAYNENEQLYGIMSESSNNVEFMSHIARMKDVLYKYDNLSDTDKLEFSSFIE